ncbi:MAG: hypothetical protein KJN92_08780, partial [Gemmatimonadetes bacterium]|nr:hypothetical protein [Gemmatimonadota bacterium]
KLLLPLMLLCLLPAPGYGQGFGVYMEVADVEGSSVGETSARAEAAVAEAGWTLLAAYDAGVDGDDCSFTARVLVVDWPEYTRAVMSQGDHGAFAAPLRISVFEDEMGVHVAAVNPRSINRTIVSEEGMEQEWSRFAAILRRTLAEGVGASPAFGDFGQFRDRGLIGKTMGVMAGGPFLEKIKEIGTVPAGEGGVEAVAQSLFDDLGAAAPGDDWGIRPVFLMNPSPGVVVLGVTGERMEARSFSIVGRGSDKSRSRFACPGLDHAAAYPIEVVLTEDGDQVKVSVVDAMFRMKMFFEDAGKLKFARNMTMPGSIEDEIRALIQAALF